MYAIPDVGPHGFHSFGRYLSIRLCFRLILTHIRIIESTLRSANNLLERLHASFFFYILTTSRTFLKVGHYLPAVILISVATMIGALGTWVDARWIEIAFTNPEKGTTRTKWITRDRPVLETLGRMIASHIVGYILWNLSPLKNRFPVSRFYIPSITS